MRRRGGLASAEPAPELLDDTVEAWVSPLEGRPDVDRLPFHLGRSGPRGEPGKAVAWRVLAQARLEEARLRWAATQPPSDFRVDPRDVWKGPRDELPPARPDREPGRPREPWSPLTRCRWRDVHAFLAQVPDAE